MLRPDLKAGGGHVPYGCMVQGGNFAVDQVATCSIKPIRTADSGITTT